MHRIKETTIRELFYNLIFIAGLIVPTTNHADNNKKTNKPDDVETLETLTIEGESLLDSFDTTKSISTINQEQMEQRQSSNIMELLQDIPGVSIGGGPRAGGMKISIRGFDNNEDILIKIDGASQNFEKYRYGNGLSIDPELLKRVEVSRGAASMTHGSGALGGVIEMETIDARDLLEAGEMIGIKAKYGHRFNNDAGNFSLTAMASPTDFLDALVSVIKRDSNNFKLPDGSRYPDSEETQLSGLAKIELYNDFSETSFGFRFSNETGAEPFDATGGIAGVGDTVMRTSEETSYTFNSHIQPETEWLDIKASVGFTNKLIKDDNSAIAGLLDITSRTNGNDTFLYDIWTAELKNKATFHLFGIQNNLTFGAQFNQEVRDSIRTNFLGTFSNPAQPPGAKESYGIFLQHQISFNDFTLGAGVRGDYYLISSSDTSEQALKGQGRESTADFYQLNPAFSLDYNILGGPFTVFYSYFEAFRAPLIDEYFSTTTTRCKTFSMFNPVPIRPRRANFANRTAFNAARAQYNIDKAAAEQDPYSVNKAICGDLYEPEQSSNHEVGLSFTYDGLFDISDRLSSKLTFFYTQVDNILESIYQNTATGEISQPGVEVHHGFEVDLSYDSDTYFSRLSLSTLDGYRSLNYFEHNSNPSVSNVNTAEDQGKQDLIDSPADKIIFTFGRKINQYNFEIGYRLKAFNNRLVTTGTKPDPDCAGGIFVVPSCNLVGEQQGYILHDLFATWRPWKRTILRLNLDNFMNTEYNLPGFGGGEGAIAPGMDIRLSLSQQF